MSNNQLITKAPSATDLTEQNSRQIFESKLSLSERIFGWYGDKYPNLDGHIEFLGENGSTAVKMFFQLKGSDKDISHYDCDISLLNYCYKAPEPTFLVFVNIPQQKVYWEHISNFYIENVLNIKDLTTFDQGTKRINFSDEKIIDKNSRVLMEECRKHYQDKSKTLIEAKEKISSEQKQVDVISKESKGAVDIYDVLSGQINSLLDNMTDKCKLYFALVYVLKPFYMDQRGDEKRRKLLGLLQLTDSQERFIVESLENANLFERVGDLVFVTNKDEAISVVNHYVDTGQLDLTEIAQLFYQQDEN
jgi:hypothetical protein